jgi:hypothetical protein
MDETYCCAGCAQGGPCICSYEADLADDGVDGLGLLFSVTPPVVADTPTRELPAARSETPARDRERVLARIG